MATLAERQARFVAHLLGKDSDFGEEIPDGPRVGRDVLMGVYRYAYGARLREVLRTNYPVLHKVVGDPLFDRIAGDYLAAVPSRHCSVRWFGDQLAAFLDATPPWSGDPWLAELTRFEWALGLCLDGPDGDPVGFEILAATPPEAWPALRFRLVPTAQRLSLDWSVPQTWRAVTDGTEPVPKPERQDNAITWLTWRRDLVTMYRSLDGAEDACLSLIADTAPFEALCALSGDLHGADNAAPYAAGYLRRWVDEALVELVLA